MDNNKQVINVRFEWKFQPTDYFESEFETTVGNYTINFGCGQISCDAIVDESEIKEKRDELHTIVTLRFLGVQCQSHQPFELQKANVTSKKADGTISAYMFPEPISIGLKMNVADIVLTDSEGNIITDTRQSRIRLKEEFGRLAQLYGATDQLAKSLLYSYNAAVKDPDNELLYLYEIREALATKYGGENGICQLFGISKTEYGDFGKLSNNTDIR